MNVRPTRRTVLASLGLAVASGLAWRSLPARAATGGALDIVATTSMIGDALRVVGAERVAVSTLMGEGVDPHTYRQTRSDIAAMVRADAIVRHGLYLEAQLEDFFETVAARKTVITLAEAAIPKERLFAHPDYENRFDPHVWMDPQLWTLVVRRLGAELAVLDPAAAGDFEARAAAHAAEIERLDGYARSVLATVPASARVLVTAHDAFGYFGKAYGFEVLGIQGLSTESEAGLATIEQLVGVLVERDIRAIFVESSVSARNVKALVEGAAARGHAVAIGGELFSDSMGRPGTVEGSYLGMIDHNVTVIARALGGTAPDTGFTGALTLART